ncbi:MAG: hypothetical protein ABSA62_13410, partial [Methyloceanibacter sp.]
QGPFREGGSNQVFGKGGPISDKPSARAHRPTIKDLSKAMTKTDASETEVLTLTEVGKLARSTRLTSSARLVSARRVFIER